MAFPITPSIGDKHVVGSVSYEWNGYAWDAAAVTGAVSITKYEYTATSGQTVFAAAGYRNKKYVDVYVNGMKLSETDYDAVDNATVVLNVGATVGDLVVIEVSDAVVMADIIKTVDVQTLASGAEATVTYIDGALEFGVPAGPQGVQGVQGIQGVKGDKGDTGEVTTAQLNAAIAGIINDGTVSATDTWSSEKIDADKQDTLVSGTNIKTINGETILGAGDITIQAGGTVDTEMSDTSENAVQNKVIKKYIDDLVGNILTQLQEINGTN